MDYVKKKRIEMLKKERAALKSMRLAILLGEPVKFTEAQIEGRLETIRKQLDSLTPATLKIQAIDYVTELSVKEEAHIAHVKRGRKGFRDLSVKEYLSYVEQKLPIRQIAIEMDVSESLLHKSRKWWVSQGLIHENISRTKEKMTVEQYLECVAKGMEPKEIAKAYNISVDTFYTKRKRWRDRGLLDNELVSS